MLLDLRSLLESGGAAYQSGAFSIQASASLQWGSQGVAKSDLYVVSAATCTFTGIGFAKSDLSIISAASLQWGGSTGSATTYASGDLYIQSSATITFDPRQIGKSDLSIIGAGQAAFSGIQLSTPVFYIVAQGVWQATGKAFATGVVWSQAVSDLTFSAVSAGAVTIVSADWSIVATSNMEFAGTGLTVYDWNRVSGDVNKEEEEIIAIVATMIPMLNRQRVGGRRTPAPPHRQSLTLRRPL